MEATAIHCPQHRHGHAAGEGKVDSHTAQAGQWVRMQMTVLGRSGDPTAGGGEVPHVASEYESRQQR